MLPPIELSSPVVAHRKMKPKLFKRDIEYPRPSPLIMINDPSTTSSINIFNKELDERNKDDEDYKMAVEVMKLKKF